MLEKTITFFFFLVLVQFNKVAGNEVCGNCLAAANALKDLSMVIMIGPAAVLILCLIIAIITIYYFVSVVGHEVQELEKFAIVFAGMIIERGIPSEISRAAYAKAENIERQSYQQSLATGAKVVK